MAIVNSGQGWGCKEDYFATINDVIVTLHNGRVLVSGEFVTFNNAQLILKGGPVDIALSVYEYENMYRIDVIAVAVSLSDLHIDLILDGNESIYGFQYRPITEDGVDLQGAMYYARELCVSSLADIETVYHTDIPQGIGTYYRFNNLFEDSDFQAMEPIPPVPEPESRDLEYINRPVTVADMFKFAKKYGDYLLSDFGANNEGYLFWDEYRTKHNKYDKLFNRMFNSFKYFMQEHGQSVNEITEDFTDEVYNHLMINAKKYEELYRINVINDENYSITDNYNITEELTKETTVDDSNVKGQRTDSTASTIGAKETEYERVYGAKETETTKAFGQHETDIDFVKGSQTDSQTDDIAGFNSNTYSDDRQRSNVYGTRSDSNTTISKTHTDTETIDEGAKTDTETVGEGARSNSESFVKGQQTDTYEGTHTEDYTLTRRGNIGVRTITEVLEYHRDFWNTYEFYTYIFKEICAELLSI